MPASLFLRIDLSKIYFPLLEKLFYVIADCKAAGFEYWATRGYASFAEQDKLYAQGRTNSLGPIVTAARGGQSAHNFGLAVDFTLDKDLQKTGLQPDWDAAHYSELGRVAKLHGLAWGGDWTKKDLPHVYWPGYATALNLEPLRTAYESTPGDVMTKLRASWDTIT